MVRLSVACVVLVLASACDLDPGADPPPDARGPSLEAIWDPRVCGGDPRARIEVRVEDQAGVAIVAGAACAECSLELGVDHIGWYRASAIALDRDGGGRALAASTLAIDGPGVRWRVPW